MFILSVVINRNILVNGGAYFYCFKIADDVNRFCEKSSNKYVILSFKFPEFKWMTSVHIALLLILLLFILFFWRIYVSLLCAFHFDDTFNEFSDHGGIPFSHLHYLTKAIFLSEASIHKSLIFGDFRKILR